MIDRNETYFAAYRMRREPEENRPGFPDRLIVRPARMEDVNGLAALHWEREGGDLNQLQERYRSELSEDPDWQRRLLLVAEDGDALAGFGRVVYFQPPLDSPTNIAPAGWYLMGLVVTPAFRRRGIGVELTRRRLDWIAERAGEAFYFVNAQNRASIALHEAFQFEEVARDFTYPGVTFTGGVGILYRKTLSGEKTP
ncbi:MAG: GNAT family N-acetyltransferase [Blastocatellia bacterium]